MSGGSRLFDIPSQAVVHGCFGSGMFLSHVNFSSSCRRSWSFWALSSSPWPRRRPRTACRPPQSSCVTFFMVSSMVSYFSAKASRACMVFWLRSCTLVFALGVLLQCGTQAPIPIVEEALHFPQFLFCCHEILRTLLLGAFTFESGTATTSFSVTNTFGVVCRVLCLPSYPAGFPRLLHPE